MIRVFTLCLLAVAFGMNVAGCASDDNVAGPPTDAGPNGGSDGGDGSVSGDGLPCDVAMVLSANCTSCHGATLSGGAPMSLVTYADLVHPALTNPSVTEAALSVSRVQNTRLPMPPSPAPMLSAADIAVLSNWVAAGTPPGTCMMGPDPFSVPPTCTSGSTQPAWVPGADGWLTMEPGNACIACHASQGEGPAFSIAGTVYPTGHEPTECNGSASTSTDPVNVVVTDANGTSATLRTNSVGNFYSESYLVPPFTVEVDYQGRVRRMAMQAPNGDCNSCHTQDGASGAPGRIVTP
jgi:cytochrome c553